MNAMEAIVVLVLLGIVAAVVFYNLAIRPAVNGIRHSRQDRAAWKQDEEEKDGYTYVFIEHPLDGRIYIGEPIPHALPYAEYFDRLLDLRTEAEERATVKSLHA
jgi:hypothetical protein